MNIGIISINIIGIAVCVYLYFDNRDELYEIQNNYNKMDSGFQAIDDRFSDSLGTVNEYLEKAVYKNLSKKLYNDSIEAAIVKQVSLGQYFTYYQGAIQATLYDVHRDLERRNRIENILLTVILVLGTINTLHLGLKIRSSK